jgi:transcription initiation factor TFIIIB Brf1 subunit/transcription initiation factor TFIIB
MKIYIQKLTKELGIRFDITRHVIDIVNYAQDEGITTSKNPSGIAAGAIYYIVRDKNIDITQKEIVQIAKITPASIRKRYKKFEKLSSNNTSSSPTYISILGNPSRLACKGEI